jgi:integral membrane protein
MPLAIRPADVPRIRTVLAVYRVSAIVTGTFLLLLVLMMVFRYGFGVDIELGGPFGFLALQPRDLIEAVNLSTGILIVHGWLYVVYLLCDFALWRLTRWSFGRFLFIALGGIIPLLSFFFEFRVPRWVDERLDAVETPAEAARQKTSAA